MQPTIRLLLNLIILLAVLGLSTLLAAAAQTPGLQNVIGDAQVIGLEGRGRVNESDVLQ
jgi:hypothetical protein